LRPTHITDPRFSAAGRRSDASATPRADTIPRLKIGGHRFYIPSAERDRRLLSVDKWPQDAASFLTEHAPSAQWKVNGKHLFRHITVEDERADDSASESPKEHHLWEALLRFPNASIYHGLPKKPFPFDKPWPNLHTMRVIGQGNKPKEQIKHIYLLHNGLNETNDLLFHYRLAAWILDARPSAVCILRPLPGHLTRYPFYGPYASTPLDDYLRDPADLFRQFLRYMTETQWLLSALVPRPQYLVAAGTNLLGEAAPLGEDRGRRGRSSDSILAEKMTEAWQAAFESNPGDPFTSKAGRPEDSGPAQGSEGKRHDSEGERPVAGAVPRAGKGTGDEGGDEYKDYSREKVEKDTLEEVVTDLRELLGWKPVLTKAAPRAYDHAGGLAEPERPCIHVVGYSIGGFVAQAVFFAWPFAVSSCTSLFAGGALRDLSPTRFAHHEEWQAVLHGMRYELDKAFRDERLSSSDKGLISGIEEPLFGYFTRIFYEVFLQYYRGGYSSRVEEFSRRLLFVSGGDDPIVRTRNVLDAAPNATLLQIGDVSHFPSGSSNGTRVESEQRRHWLPEVGKMIANFTEWSESLLNRTLADSWGVYLGRGGNKSVHQEDARHEQADNDDLGILDNDAFSRAMRTLVSKVEPPDGESRGSGWLLIGRNEVPPAFLEKNAILTFAQAVHHSEGEITRCIKDLRARSKRLDEIHDRVSLLIPDESDAWFKDQKRRERFYSKSETASAARIPTNEEAEKMWEYFVSHWVEPGAAREVKLDEHSLDKLGSIGEAEAKRLDIDRLSMTGLPDVWLALSEEARQSICGNSQVRAHNESSVISWAVELSEEWGRERKGASRNARPGRPPAGGRRKTWLAELKDWVKDGEVMAIEISAAELNARYRGRLLIDAEDVRKAIIHWALAYEARDAPAGDGRAQTSR
jgi:hypothetical protein